MKTIEQQTYDYWAKQKAFFHKQADCDRVQAAYIAGNRAAIGQPTTGVANMLTESRIIEIRDALLPSQGESFDCIAFARAIEIESAVWTPRTMKGAPTGVEILVLIKRHGWECGTLRDRTPIAVDRTVRDLYFGDGNLLDESDAIGWLPLPAIAIREGDTSADR